MVRMMDGPRAILSPLLLISYVFGIKIIEFPAGKLRPWCSFLYILLLWSIYYFLLWCKIRNYIIIKSILTKIYVGLHNSMVLLSVVLGIYYDKKYRSCLKKLAIVDDTLEKVGVMTDYQKLYMKSVVTIFGWFTYIVYTTTINTLWHRENYSAIYSVYICILIEYPAYVNFLDDIVMIRTLGYVELKFEQLGEYLRKLGEYNEQEINRTWEHSILLPCQTKSTKSINSEFATWIIIHLHLELCKISRMLNSIFELQMTIKMGVYFAVGAISFRELFNVLLIHNYTPKKILLIVTAATVLAMYIFRLFIINYMCEKISVKANAAGDIVNRIPYSILDVVARENISQFLVQLNLTPLKFYGLRLFQFGLTFFQGFINAMSTIIVILIQSYRDT